MSLLLLSLFLRVASAAELVGVSVPDSVTVGGTPLVLNGLGLREKVVIDIYVGALYLPAKTTSATKAAGDDVAKRLEMHFIYNTVTVEQQNEAFNEALSKMGDVSALRARFDLLEATMEVVHSGDTVAFEYVPGKGTTVTVRGKVKATIPGADFMKALWSIYLGAHPPTEDLKKGLLGLR